MNSGEAPHRQLRRDLLARLPPTTCSAVESIVAAAEGAVYAVGGSVRDLLLRRPIVDADLVIEGDAPTIVRRALPRAKVTLHVRFRTASVAIGGIRIDVATSRTETYDCPGALPRITPAPIDEDLRRRDLSVNAMALRLSGGAALLDPAGGARDITERRIRVLHEASFRDDPTRIFRALRYAARLDFEVDPRTEELLARDVRYVDAVGGERLRREIELMLGEPTGGRALDAARGAGVLQRVHPALSWDNARAAALGAPVARVPRLPYGFALLAATASPDEGSAIVSRLHLKRDEAAAVSAVASMASTAQVLRRPTAKPSGIVVVLDGYSLAAVAAWAAIESDPIARQLALRYLDEWRHVGPLLHGDELMALGVPAGPHVRRGLQLIRAARLDGWAGDRDDERALALRFAKSIRDSVTALAPPELRLN